MVFFIVGNTTLPNRKFTVLSAVDKEVLRLRTASVDFSPLLPPQKIYFVVQKSGVQGVNINNET